MILACQSWPEIAPWPVWSFGDWHSHTERSGGPAVDSVLLMLPTLGFTAVSCPYLSPRVFSTLEGVPPKWSKLLHTQDGLAPLRAWQRLCSHSCCLVCGHEPLPVVGSLFYSSHPPEATSGVQWRSKRCRWWFVSYNSHLCTGPPYLPPPRTFMESPEDLSG